MDLAQAVQDGRQFWFADGVQQTMPLDFVLADPNGTIIAATRWWVQDDPLAANQVFVTDVVFDTMSMAQDGTGPLGALGAVQTPSDEDVVDMLHRSAAIRAVNRMRYIRQVGMLRDAFMGRFDLSPWMAFANSIKAVDPVAAFVKMNSCLRKIGRVFLNDIDNALVEVLVVDENGNAATANATQWAQSMANQWVRETSRPPIEDFIRWVQGQEPHGPTTIERVEVAMLTGSVDDIARASMR